MARGDRQRRSRKQGEGFYATHHPGGITWLNNTSYRNPANYNLRGRDPADNKTIIPGRDRILKNNLGFYGGAEVVELNVEESDVSYNYFTLPVRITAEDFVSLEESQLMAPAPGEWRLARDRFSAFGAR